MDEGSTDACIAVATEERVGMTVSDGTLTVLVNVVITAAVGVKGGRMMEDVGHAAEMKRYFRCCVS